MALRDRTWTEEQVCSVCPAQLLRVGEFDVTDRPGPDSPYDREAGYRINTATGAPTCVHPYRVELPPGRYCSAGEPLPAVRNERPEPQPRHLRLPEDLVDLDGWLVAVLRAAPPQSMAPALFAAEAIATERFPSREVVAAMRRVMSVELPG